MADSEENNVVISSSFSSKLTKWRVNEGQDIKERAVLALYEKIGQSDDQKGFNLQPKLRSNANGRIKKLLVAEGDIVPPGKPVVQIEKSVACEHNTVMKDLCCDCGMDLRKLISDQDEPSSPTLATVSMIHNIPELRVTKDEAEAVGKKDEERLLNTRKLALVVDLDQTMIHTTIELVPSDMKDVYHFNLSGYPLWYHTKFRPFAHEFLEKISELYELHIFTMGSRMYAHTIARMLDPDKRLFGHRIRSRDDCFNAFSKSNDLRSLFPRGDSMVCIIDDRNDVWNNAPNLIKVKPYQFFKGVGDINAPSDKQNETSVLKSDEKTIKTDKQEESCKDEVSALTKFAQNEIVSNSGDKFECNIKDDTKSKQGQSESTVCNTHETGIVKEEECKSDAVSESDSLSQSTEDVKQVMEAFDSDSKSINSTTKQLLNNVQNGGIRKKVDKEVERVNIFTDKDVDSMYDYKTLDTMLSADSTDNNEEYKEVHQSGHKLTQDNETLNIDGSGETTQNSHAQQLQTDQLTITRNKSTVHIDSKSTEKSSAQDAVRDKDTALCNNNNASHSNEKRTNQMNDTKDNSEEEMKTAKAGEKENASDEPVDGTTKCEHFDNDDYLIHLEDILRRIHDKFYDTVDKIKELKAKGVEEVDSTIARYCSPGTLSPCTKQIIKQLQHEVLKGANIVFTGVIPTNIPPEKSGIWQRSERLGAKVSRNLVTPTEARDPSDVTTHVIAARLGTEKTYHAIKSPGVKIVKPDWLWCCEERWEWVDERLFGVEGVEKYKKEVRSKRTPQGTPHNWKKYTKTENNPEFMKTRNDYDKVTKDETMRERTCSSSSADLLMASLHPLLSFSSTEMEAMDKEVEDLMNSDVEDDTDVIGSISGSSSASSSSSSSSSSSPSSDSENSDREEATRKRKKTDSGSDDNASKKRKDELSRSDDESDDYTRRSSPSDDDDENDDDDDDDMAALLEAELSYD